MMSSHGVVILRQIHLRSAVCLVMERLSGSQKIRAIGIRGSDLLSSHVDLGRALPYDEARLARTLRHLAVSVISSCATFHLLSVKIAHLKEIGVNLELVLLFFGCEDFG